MAPRESWPLVYQIRVRGQLGETMRSAFPALQAQAADGDTVLTGVLAADQAALDGVLAEVEGLALELIEVCRLPPGEARNPRREFTQHGAGVGPAAPSACASTSGHRSRSGRGTCRADPCGLETAGD